jgi:D-glycero-alpha-D-manno-heptose 1-phosphate guanylyltransferase
MKEAIVLAGGFGSRLRALVSAVPKPMADINGRPFLEIVLDKLVAGGVERVIISLGYMAEVVMDHFGPIYKGLEVVYEVEETPLGTGGAIRQSLARCFSDHILVLNGDTYVELDQKELGAFYSQVQKPTVVACEVDDVSRYGKLKIVDGLIRGMAEKESSGKGYINSGVYVLPVNSLDVYEPGSTFSFEDGYLKIQAESGNLHLFRTKGKFIDIGIPEDYLKAQTYLTD